jgi:hypothetical protein
VKWQVRDERGFGLALVRADDEAEAVNIFLNWQLNGMVYWHGVPPSDPKTLHAVPVEPVRRSASAGITLGHVER